MFLPTTPAEKEKLGIKQFDVILVSGDIYERPKSQKRGTSACLASIK